ncbi:hypothetical protein JCM30471_27090 [Desulfuromonas carbonis]|uniref:S8 family serine peptidase n=1 Tax=Desulfuromonas sp. DDH964 TaxID=1823759 RepID=UPI00078DC9AC|nr:S8 family serine peptidase [Desulfuromonas sp. DDH964]AMV70902.1 subtilase family serine protease [Desulfuromonas sp. DDH964]
MRVLSRNLLSLILLLFLAGCGPDQQPSSGDSLPSAMNYRPGEILVGVTASPVQAAAVPTLLPGAKETGRVELRSKKSVKAATASETNSANTILRYQLPEGMSVEEALAELEGRAGILFAEPNFLVHRAAVPNDPYFGQQWALQNSGQTLTGNKGTVTGTPGADIGAVAAWATGTGDSSIIVAIIDSGLDYDHPDLAGNIWVNPGESGLDNLGREKATNHVDDDGNGYIDDLHGWNFVSKNNLPFDDDVDGHGSHVAGIIGASGDNQTGVTGINWRVSLLPLKFLDRFGNGDLFNAVAAYNYAANNGARVINASYTYPQNCSFVEASLAEQAAISAARSAGVLVVAAAGNFNCNNDIYPFYPGGHPLDNILSVAATDPLDRLAAAFSNYGRTTVDLGAPGLNIYSTIRQALTGMDGRAGYNYMSGTSMAAPQVSGAAALLWSLHPELTYAEVRDALLLSVDQVPDLQGKVASNGRLNVAAALAFDFTQFAPAAPADLTIDQIAPGAVDLSWRDLAGNETAFVVERSEGGAFTQVGRVAANVTTFVDSSPPDAVQVAYRVKAVAGVASSPYSNVASTFLPLNPPTGLGAAIETTLSVRVYWHDESLHEEGYALERRRNNEVGFTRIATLPVNGTWYVDATISRGETYLYRVKALHATLGDSVYSPELAVTLPTEQSSSGGGGCFIATAAWGTPLATEIDSLRRFRDQVLLQYLLGQKFVSAYYRWSPPVAAVISRHDWLRAVVRFALQPLVWLADQTTSATAMQLFTPEPPAALPQALVGFSGATEGDRIDVILQGEGLAVKSRQEVAGKPLILVEIPPGKSLEEIQQRLARYPEVEYVEPNRQVGSR